MSARRVLAALVAPLAFAAVAPLGAQPAADSAADGRSASWRSRVAVSARVGELLPAGHSELFALMNDALAPGARALRPVLAGGALHVRAVGPFGVALGAEAGGSTVTSVSRAQPGAGAAARQQTSLDLTAVQYAGMEWQALRWRGAGPRAADRLRVVLGAGGGLAGYRLHQWGSFVDARRDVAFEGDFVSHGRGAIGYASAALEVPLRRSLAVQGEVRRQVGSAPMSADFASFDRLDLGGTRLGLAVVLRPWVR